MEPYQCLSRFDRCTILWLVAATVVEACYVVFLSGKKFRSKRHGTFTPCHQLKKEKRTCQCSPTPLLCQCSPTKPPRKIPTPRMATARNIPQRPPLLTPLQRHLRHRHPSQPLLPQKPHPRLPHRPRHCPKRHTLRI